MSANQGSSDAIINVSTSTEISVPQRTLSNALQLASVPVLPIPKEKPQKRVLDEDTYVESIDKIIQRDFFPDLPKLRTQLEWLEAEASSDLEKMREIHMRLRGKDVTQSVRGSVRSSIRGSVRETPNSFETPASFTPRVPPPATPSSTSDSSTKIPNPTLPTPSPSPISTSALSDEKASNVDTSVGLNTFLMHNTSEDNASFETLLDKHNEQRRKKYSWMFEKERSTEQLLLTGGITSNPNSNELLPWSYSAKNNFMYNKDGVPMSEKEEIAVSAGLPKQTVLENTRFQPQTIQPTEKDQSNNEAMYSMLGAEERAMLLHRKQLKDGKIDLDELRGFKKVAVPMSPKVGGYGFVLTPSPAPGVDASPFTTWGSIEGTPLLLDVSSTPYTPGPTFKIPDTPKREQVAMQLNETVKDKAKKLKEKAQQAKQNLKSPARGSTPQTDTQLRASYSSPKVKSGHAPFSPFKSISSPITKSSKTRTPSTPKIVVAAKNKSTESPLEQQPATSSSLTDNLLKI